MTQSQHGRDHLIPVTCVEGTDLLEVTSIAVARICHARSQQELRSAIEGAVYALGFGGFYLDGDQHSQPASGTSAPPPVRSEQIGKLTFLSWTDRPLWQGALYAAAIVGEVATARAAAVCPPSDQSDANVEKYRSLGTLQQEILKWIAAGKSNAEIAAIIGITKRATDYHSIELFKNLDVISRAQAAAFFGMIQLQVCAERGASP